MTLHIFKAAGKYGCPDSIRSIALGYISRVCYISPTVQRVAYTMKKQAFLQASEVHDRHRGTLRHCLLDVVK